MRIKNVKVLFVLLFTGCYAAHEPASTQEPSGSTPEADEVFKPNDSPGRAPPLPGALSRQNETTSAAGAGGFDPAADPILFQVVPEESCSNKDLWITIEGTSIHWKAVVTLRYPHSGARAKINSEQFDECKQPYLEWDDSTRLRFRTHENLDWNEMGSFASGFYLVSVENPDGSVSNEVGLNLQWCGENEGGESIVYCGR